MSKLRGADVWVLNVWSVFLDVCGNARRGRRPRGLVFRQPSVPERSAFRNVVDKRHREQSYAFKKLVGVDDLFTGRRVLLLRLLLLRV